MRWPVVLVSKNIRNALSAYRLIDFGKGGGMLEGGVIVVMCDRSWTEVLCADLSLNNAST